MKEHNKRKILIPAQKVNGSIVHIDRVTNVSGMIDRGLGIVDEQLTKLALLSRQAGGAMDEKEIRKLEVLLKSLVNLSKEERERDKSNKDSEALQNLTDAELVKLAQETMGDSSDPGT